MPTASRLAETGAVDIRADPSDSAANRPDGTDADYVYTTPVEPDIQKSTVELFGARLLVGSARLHGVAEMD
ncbi:hypothetical protein [Mycolicibacterium sarraceniae]|uniref:Uncharacterized protein n=1 Tax=Mycolicibacterium sarraceniae TaxID=1534348 RepID=A0A7I7SW44_9MYCO|nr:hypothetical protein [Mycolicibacterium sarraceniae]BBY61224.1 hypothetical protein MSAR_43600 [Mycolicibacterium sarraceniae]